MSITGHSDWFKSTIFCILLEVAAHLRLAYRGGPLYNIVCHVPSLLLCRDPGEVLGLGLDIDCEFDRVTLSKLELALMLDEY